MTINTQHGLTAFISQPVSLLNKINLPNRQQQIIIFQVIAAALGLVALCWTAIKTRQCVLNKRIRTSQSKSKSNIEIKSIKNDANKEKLNSTTQSTVEIKIEKVQTEFEKNAAAKNGAVNENSKPIEEKPEIAKVEVLEVTPSVESSETTHTEPQSPKIENPTKVQTTAPTHDQTSVQIPELTLVQIATPSEKEIEAAVEKDDKTKEENILEENDDEGTLKIHFEDQEIVNEFSQSKSQHKTEGQDDSEDTNNIASPSSKRTPQNSLKTATPITAESHKLETPKSSLSVADLLANQAEQPTPKNISNPSLPQTHQTPTKSPVISTDATPPKKTPLRRLNALLDLMKTPDKKTPTTITSADKSQPILIEKATQFMAKLNENHDNKVCKGSNHLGDPRIQSNDIVLTDSIQVLALMKRVDGIFLSPQQIHPNTNEKDKVRIMLYAFAQAVREGHQSIQIKISKNLTNKQKYQQEKDFYRGFKTCNVKISKKTLPDNHRLITYDLKNFDFQAALTMIK